MFRHDDAPRRTIGNVRFALRVLLGFGATIGIGAALASGCGNGGIVGTIISSDCPLDDEGKLAVPLECCPCPTPEDCQNRYWSKGLATPKIAESCCDQGWPDAVCGDGSKHGAEPRLCCTVAPAERCNGQCVQRAPETWTGPELVYRGGGYEPFTCPESAPDLALSAWPEPKLEPPTCPTCGCAEPKGSCALPQTWSVSSAGCLDPGGPDSGVKTNFDPPAGWDGSCNADKAIAEGKLCGNEPCVSSLVVSAPIIKEEPCDVVVSGGSPSPGPPPKLAADGTTRLVSDQQDYIPAPSDPVARACAPLEPWPACTNKADNACVPAHSPEFAVCIRKAGDVACPDGWPDRQVVYDKVDVTQECSACACSAPEGASCTVKITATSSMTCSGMPIEGVTVSTDKPFGCYDIMPSGAGLGSKAAEFVNFTHGACTPSGGEPIEDIQLYGPTTLCCLSE